VLVALLVSTVPVSILETHYAMHVIPFWAPGHYREQQSPYPTLFFCDFRSWEN